MSSFSDSKNHVNRLENPAVKVLLTTSGTGSRLGDITQHMNKSLVNVGGRAAIDHIIDSYPKDTSFVITLGYKGELVYQYLAVAYPETSFEYVYVDPFEGPGSSLVYSMFQAKDNLQCPFIFHSCDTLVKEVSLTPESNWVGVNATLEGINNGAYRTVSISDGKISTVNEKGFPGAAAYIGLVGVNDYTVFWGIAEELLQTNPSWLSDANVVEKMLERGHKFKSKIFKDWLDTGNLGSLEFAREHIWVEDKPVLLEKPGQSVYVRDKDVIKFFSNPEMVSCRVERAKNLKGAAPKITGVSHNFFAYEKIQGRLFTEGVTPAEFYDFLNWCKETIWAEPVSLTCELKQTAREFYFDKTRARLKMAHQKLNNQDQVESINGEDTPTIEYMLSVAEEIATLDEGVFVKGFHGDLHNSNIFSTGETWGLIDWREDFGGNKECGDIYYDLAKLNHGLIVSHDMVERGLFTIDCRDDKYYIDIMRKDSLVECQEDLAYFVKNELNLDWIKTNIITALIYLNISPLHHSPYDRFLYYYGKRMLSQWLAL